jgi:hypothetical protein
MWSGLSRRLFPGRWHDFGAGEDSARCARSWFIGGWRSRPGWGWAGLVVGTPRRGMVDRRTATLMYAGRNRRSAPRRKVPLTKRAPAWPAQSTHGDRSCRDGAPARGAAGGHRGADPGGDRWLVTMSGRHLGPQEPGELAGDGGDDHILGVLAGGQPTKAAAQPQLGRPGPGDHLGIQALLAPTQADPDRGPVLVGPGRPRPAGRAGARCHSW